MYMTTEKRWTREWMRQTPRHRDTETQGFTPQAAAHKPSGCLINASGRQPGDQVKTIAQADQVGLSVRLVEVRNEYAETSAKLDQFFGHCHAHSRTRTHTHTLLTHTHAFLH